MLGELNIRRGESDVALAGGYALFPTDVVLLVGDASESQHDSAREKPGLGGGDLAGPVETRDIMRRRRIILIISL